MTQILKKKKKKKKKDECSKTSLHTEYNFNTNILTKIVAAQNTMSADPDVSAQVIHVLSF